MLVINYYVGEVINNIAIQYVVYIVFWSIHSQDSFEVNV